MERNLNFHNFEKYIVNDNLDELKRITYTGQLESKSIRINAWRIYFNIMSPGNETHMKS